MRTIKNEMIYDILACPYCENSLLKMDYGLVCSNCKEKFPESESGQLDLRIKKEKKISLQFKITNEFLLDTKTFFRFLKINPTPEIKFSKFKIPIHLSKELLSYFPKAKENGFMLDLGCGNTIHRNVCEKTGFKYIGLDYNSQNAHILGDAHAIPFKKKSFNFILSIAVLEHIKYPFVAIKEIYRVLKPGGLFIGTVAFLEPFHANSYYHHTHIGISNLLSFAGFNINIISPSSRWTALISQAMALFPSSIPQLSKIMVLPLEKLHRIWWKIIYFVKPIKKLTEMNRTLKITGAFTFIANKD